MVEENKAIIVRGPSHIGVFAVGGGGGGDVDECGGSSGFFVYDFYLTKNETGNLVVNITIGAGGLGNGGYNGEVTRVEINGTVIEANGGGGMEDMAGVVEVTMGKLVGTMGLVEKDLYC